MASRILIVDDEPCVASVLARLLGNKGYDTTAVNSYNEAVALLEQSSFNLALIDYVMPGKGGLLLSRYVRRHYPGMGTIIISAIPDAALYRSGLGAADRFIDKAQSIKPLLNAIAEVLKEKAQELARLRRYFDRSTKALPSSAPSSAPGGAPSSAPSSAPRTTGGSRKSLPEPIVVGDLCLDLARQRFFLGTVSLTQKSFRKAS